MQKDLICIKHCSVKRGGKTLLDDVSWTMKTGEAWLVTGPNGGGKAPFLDAIAAARCAAEGGCSPAACRFSPNEGRQCQRGSFNTVFKNIEMVSLEKAARLIQEERERDESEYLDGGVDNGRTGAVYIAEGYQGQGRQCLGIAKSGGEKPSPSDISTLSMHRVMALSKRVAGLPEVKLCGVEDILDKGLKYMSTGQIRRTLLARALVCGAQCLILSDPFAGLDTESRTLLRDFFGRLANKQVTGESSPCVILGMERYVEIPEAITHVLEFKAGKVSFCGTRADYEKHQTSAKTSGEEEKARLCLAVRTLQEGEHNTECSAGRASEPIIEMRHVNVGWDEKLVLRDLTWTLYEGEHWLIRGPNGSGKTTFLELITGDNGQVYSNDVKMFGRRRGTGESIWDIKAQLGIVSYRLHVEYRMVGGTSLLDTVVSGFRDSIGLYGAATDVEAASARKWLSLAGFAGREGEAFSSLSYGEQRSILILRAAVKGARVLILDEPCHGLSEEARRMVLSIMETVAERGKATLLHVTHEADEVLPCEHHILELDPAAEPMYRIVVSVPHNDG